MSKIKVLTLNTHSWLEEQPLEKLKQIAQQIEAADYDVIALQEVNQLIESAEIIPDEYFNPTKDQPAIHEDNFAYQLVRQLQLSGCYYHWSWTFSHIGYDRYQEGVAILAKTPLKSEALLVSQADDPTDYHTRRLLISRSTYQDRPFTVVSCHFSWWETEATGFAYEWQQLENQLLADAEPVLLVGDFNNPVDSKGYEKILKSPLNVKDSFTTAQLTVGEHTVLKAIDGWKENHAYLRIDYQFVSSDFQVQVYRIVFDGKETPIVSDHFGIETDLSF